MEAGFSQDVLQHVEQFWSMLDDLADSDPAAYKKFIQHQLRDAKEQCAPPEPHISLHTKILIPEEKDLFINVCKWNMIPAPQSQTHPVPLGAGRLEEMDKESDMYTVFDVAYNPVVLKMADEDATEMDQLIRLAMKYIEETHKVRLCHSYQIADFRLKGSLKRMRENLRSFQSPSTDVKEEGANGTETPLLHQIKNISVHCKQQQVHHHIGLLNKDTGKSPKQCLIEEISSSEVLEKDLPKPFYELSIVKAATGESKTLELKVELPELTSVSECDLSISTDDVVLEAPGKYKLQLDLPFSVNEEAASAQFNKKNRTLLVTIPAL
ncbi:PIH1 domain-containing protein 2 isoform X2 [Pleurodeles waltl]